MSILSKRIKATWYLRYFGWTKVPLIFYCRPSVIEINSNKAVVKIPLLRRNRNHLNSMYFGVLAVGADIAGGLLAMDQIKRSRQKLSLIFKDFKADFYKRPEGDTIFTCNDGLAVKQLVQDAIDSRERVNMPLKITANVPQLFGEEPVAEFILTLSLKDKS